MLVVKVNKERYEYDIHSLVKAFYPEENVKVLTPMVAEDKRKEWEAFIGFIMEIEEEDAKISIPSFVVQEYLKEFAGRSFSWNRQEGIQNKNTLKQFLYAHR